MHSWPLLLPSFSLSSFLFFFFSPSFALICHIEPGPICHIEPGPICQIEPVFLLFMASVRSRPPGPPAVPGVTLLLFFSLRLLLLTHFGETPVVENLVAQAACVRHACLRAQLGHCYYRLLLLTHFGETSVCEIIFHPIFWHNQKINAKKKKK